MFYIICFDIGYDYFLPCNLHVSFGLLLIRKKEKDDYPKSEMFNIKLENEFFRIDEGKAKLI